nr:Chain C, C3P [synthetic construct]8CIR_D Chain D, C3P [synthetic construct]8CIS_B Chain B, C3P [synthetic construct]
EDGGSWKYPDAFELSG